MLLVTAMLISMVILSNIFSEKKTVNQKMFFAGGRSGGGGFGGNWEITIHNNIEGFVSPSFFLLNHNIAIIKNDL